MQDTDPVLFAKCSCLFFTVSKFNLVVEDIQWQLPEYVSI